MQPQRRHPPPNCKQAPSFQPKTSWDSGWLTSASRVTARDQLPRTDTRCTRNWGWDSGGDKAHRTWESVLIKLLAAWAARAGRHKTQAQPSLRLCWVPENLNLSGLGLGSGRNSGPAPWRKAWSLSSVDRGSTRRERGQTHYGQNTASAPHTGQRYLSAAPLPPHSATKQANLHKGPPPPTCVRAEIRHWRDLQKEAK